MKKLGSVAVTILIACSAIFGYLQYREYNLEQGRKAYRHYGCAQCHEAGAAPDLTKLDPALDRETMVRFIENPEQVYREKGVRPLDKQFFPMPVLHVSHKEAEQLADFILQSRQK